MGRMAASEAKFLKIQMNEKGIRAVLPTIVCEWVLIILLFIDASLSYLVTKFARYCQLPTPCLLCSRIDHVLDGEEPDFYWSLLCSSHRSEVSSLISCQLHDKLADGYKMCEECLLSFTAKNKPNPDTHRFMTAKLGAEHGCGFQSSLTSREFLPGSVSTRSCSCCSKPWRSRHGSQRLFQQKPPPAVIKPNLPLPNNRSPSGRSPSSHSPSDKHSAQSNPFGKRGSDNTSRTGYSGLKIALDADSEPESALSDGNGIVRERSELKKNVTAPSVLEVKSPTLDSFEQININDMVDVKSLVSDVSIGYALGDRDKANHSDSELSSLDISPSSSTGGFTLHQSYSDSAGFLELASLPVTPPSVGPSPKKSENTIELASIGHIPLHEEVKGLMSTRSEEDFMVNEDLELRSSALGIDSPSNSTSPQLQRPGDELEAIVCLERSELDGASIIAKLKQQIYNHQKRITVLYKELEEERSASNVAANEAMAMIRRLQEEKSALHMEAMQYLRMMEEQAEHDADDLERANDLLAEREKDIQDLEMELEFYKLNFPEGQMVENIIDGNSRLEENVTMKSSNLSHPRNNLMSIEVFRGMNGSRIELSWLEFKEDKLCISQDLESLESKLQQNELSLSNRRPSSEETSSSSTSDDDSPRKASNGEVNLVVAIENEISDLRDRLKRLEANQDFLERALVSLQNGHEGIQVVIEIARQLQDLWNIGIRIRSDPVP